MSQNKEPPDPLDSDPLDRPSDCYIIDAKGKQIELTFRELAKVCADDMKLWDSLSPGSRAANQQANDSNWKPIQPGAGQRRYRRWRG